MYLQCDNQGHVEKWLADFHRRKNPDRDNKRRHATQLELWVSEAKVRSFTSDLLRHYESKIISLLTDLFV